MPMREDGIIPLGCMHVMCYAVEHEDQVLFNCILK